MAPPDNGEDERLALVCQAQGDLWSFGIILCDMRTGEHPWNIENMSLMPRRTINGS